MLCCMNDVLYPLDFFSSNKAVKPLKWYYLRSKAIVPYNAVKTNSSHDMTQSILLSYCSFRNVVPVRIILGRRMYDYGTDHENILQPRWSDKIECPIDECPPYSPDFSPCDFHIFGELKRKLKLTWLHQLPIWRRKSRKFWSRSQVKLQSED